MKTIIILIVAMILFSCNENSKNKVYFPDKSMAYNKSYDDVWNKLTKWCDSSVVSVKCIDQKTGLISFEFNLNSDMSDKYVDYLVNGKSAFFQHCIGKIYIIVKQQTEKVIVNIDSYYEAEAPQDSIQSKFVTSYLKKVKCQSTGILEKEIFEYINK